MFPHNIIIIISLILNHLYHLDITFSASTDVFCLANLRVRIHLGPAKNW